MKDEMEIERKKEMSIKKGVGKKQEMTTAGVSFRRKQSAAETHNKTRVH